MKYRRKPEIVEAGQWWKDGDTPVVEKMKFELEPWPGACCGECGCPMVTHGEVIGYQVCPGDYIVAGQDSELWVMTSQQFEAEFEPVEEE